MTAGSTLHIKNMVCPRCIAAVQGLLNDLNIDFASVQLGEVVLKEELDEGLRNKFKAGLLNLGFELLESEKSALISRIKSLVIDQVHNREEPLKVNFSTYLSENLQRDYTYLSKLFSSTEGITIEKFITRQKMERVKELLFYNQLTISEIAFQLDYSSAAHLSSKFKSETGMTPTEFKNQKKPGHRNLDSL